MSKEKTTGGTQFTPEEMERLLHYASGRLDTSPEALKAAFARDGLYGLAKQAAPALSKAEADEAQALLNDPQQLERLLNSPQIRQLLERLPEQQ